MTSRKRPSLAELEANIEKEASWAEKNFGPQVTGRLTKPGRPAKGAVIEPTRPHSLRVQESIWQALSYKAQKAGLSVNQAAQLALLEWAKR
jgi:predicted HicB family RNase H-like nuclease